MAKGKRRAFNDPAKQLEDLQKARQEDGLTGIGGWGKGIITKISDDGYVNIGTTPTEPNKFYGKVKQIETDWYKDFKITFDQWKQEYPVDVKEEPKVEITKDWAEKWADEHS